VVLVVLVDVAAERAGYRSADCSPVLVVIATKTGEGSWISSAPALRITGGGYGHVNAVGGLDNIF
jgi:hypothetical protein